MDLQNYMFPPIYTWISYCMQKKLRPFYATEEETRVFVNTRSRSFSGSGMLQTIQRYWSLGTPDSVPNFSFNEIRHGVVILIHSENPSLKAKLAEQMTHSSVTASKYYKDLQGVASSQEAFNQLFETVYNDKHFFSYEGDSEYDKTSHSFSHDTREPSVEREETSSSQCMNPRPETSRSSKGESSQKPQSWQGISPSPNKHFFSYEGDWGQDKASNSFSQDTGEPPVVSEESSSSQSRCKLKNSKTSPSFEAKKFYSTTQRPETSRRSKGESPQKPQSWQDFSPSPTKSRKQFFSEKERKIVIEILEPHTKKYKEKLSVTQVRNILPRNLVKKIILSKFPNLRQTGTNTDQETLYEENEMG